MTISMGSFSIYNMHKQKGKLLWQKEKYISSFWALKNNNGFTVNKFILSNKKFLSEKTCTDMNALSSVQTQLDSSIKHKDYTLSTFLKMIMIKINATF